MSKAQRAICGEYMCCCFKCNRPCETGCSRSARSHIYNFITFQRRSNNWEITIQITQPSTVACLLIPPINFARYVFPRANKFAAQQSLASRPQASLLHIISTQFTARRPTYKQFSCKFLISLPLHNQPYTVYKPPLPPIEYFFSISQQ